MSSNDKTRQKLVDSMRATKAADSTKTDSAKAAPAKQAEPVAAKPAAASSDDKSAKQKKTPAPAPAPAPKAPKNTGKKGSDPFQTARRVWPD